MTETDRRAFLRKLAKGTVYAAPVIRSLAAPTSVAAQVSPKMMMQMMMFMGFMFMMGNPFGGPVQLAPPEPTKVAPPWSPNEEK